MKKDLIELQQLHPRFLYLDFNLNLQNKDLLLSHSFQLESTSNSNISFETALRIKNLSQLPTADQLNEFQAHAFNLGMVESISYWKAALSPTFEVRAGQLLPDQQHFWKKLFINGLSEFFYINKISPVNHSFFDFELSRSPHHQISPLPSPLSNSHKKSADHPPRVLVPLGGGKDSLVTLEILKKNFEGEIILFALNPTPAVREIVKLHPHLKYIEAERQIDPQLLELNRAGYMNGHTPFSAYLAFLTHFIASLEGIEFIALSNEASANQNSLIYQGLPINHQYSKSYEFEDDFIQYALKYLVIDQNPAYFSLLRPWNELQIAAKFSQLPQYFDIFVSCNRGQRQGTWCGACPKCTFAWLMLAPYLTTDQLEQIFNINILSNESNYNSLLELLNLTRHKPLECVGTYEESQTAVFLLYQKVKQYDQRLSNILEKEIIPRLNQQLDLSKQAKQILTNFNSQHHLPPQFDKIMTNEHHQQLIPYLKNTFKESV